MFRFFIFFYNPLPPSAFFFILSLSIASFYNGRGELNIIHPIFYYYTLFVSEIITAEAEVKEEFVPLDVKVELKEGDTPIEFNIDGQAAGCMKGKA